MDYLMIDLEMATWLLQSLSIPEEIPSLIMYEGYGPYRWEVEGIDVYSESIAEWEFLEEWTANLHWVEFTELIEFALNPYDNEFIDFFHYPDLEMLIVGRDGWSQENLLTALRMRAGRTLKVYSQEMFLSYLITGKDPFNETARFIRRFGKGHPALEYLMEVDIGFDWPSTQVSSSLGTGSSGTVDRPKKGLLRYMGYKVGKSSRLSARQRRTILDQVLQQPLTSEFYDRFDERYLDEWGKPHSELRLRKLANTIAALCVTEKKKMQSTGFDYAKAITEREADLAWLKQRHDNGRFRFAWPNTKVD